MNRDFLPLKPSYMHRDRLDRLIEKGLNYSLISVVAGPGYGKTMAVAGYAKSTPMRLIWLRLQETDNDIYRMWTHFTQAVKRELPELAEDLKKTALSAVLGVGDVFSQIFQKALESGSPILMVLDNFERVTTPHIMDFLQMLLKVELDDLHIILISNEKLPLGGIMPSSGQLRISMDDLSFTLEEIAALFAQYQLDYTEKEISAIAENTGRWPLALHLICVNQSGENVSILREMTYRQLAAELFDKHYFSTFPEEMQVLLVKLSHFERFPLELVNLLTTSDTGWYVDELSRNVFISYDYSLELFQFQKMYRSFLSHRQALIPQAQKDEMFSFMGEWCLEHEFYYEALDYFWAVRDYDQYLKTVERLPRIRRGINITSDILQALDQFPEEYARLNPSLDFCRAVLLLNGMQVGKAEALLTGLLERLTGQEDKTEETLLLLGDVCVVLADISVFLNRNDGLAYIKKAVEYLPNGCKVRTHELMLAGNNSVFYLPDGEPGRLAQMEQYFFEFTKYSDLVSNGSGYGYEWLFAAQAAFLSEQFEKSRENCHLAIAKAKIMEQHDIICNAYWDLMRTEFYFGDYRRAKQWLDELTNYVNSGRITDMYELRDCAVSWFYLRVGEYDMVVPWVADAAQMRSDDMLDVGRNRIIVIYYLTVQGRMNEAYAEMTRLEEIFRRNGKWHEKILLQIHKSILLLEKGSRAEAVRVFKTAYDMVFQNNISVIFAEFGSNMQRIIRAANAQTDIEFDPDWLAALFKQAGSFEKREAAMVKAYRSKHQEQDTGNFNLNPREIEILTYMSRGMTRTEIAQLLSTSLSNVKRYITSIYSKLGALNRADAIHIAHMNGLVSDAEPD